jgi:hypothetical protein
MGGGGANVSVGLLALLALFGTLALLSKYKLIWGRWISYATFLVIIWIFLSGQQTPNYEFGFALISCLVIGFLFGRSSSKTSNQKSESNQVNHVE